jgi:anti-sigma B factor antagonist
VAPSVAEVTMHGEHDIGTAAMLQAALDEAIAHSSVIVDLSECAFIDSTVITLLLKARQRVSDRGEQMVIVLPPEQHQVARVIEMTGLAEFLPIFQLRDDAIAALKPIGQSPA